MGCVCQRNLKGACLWVFVGKLFRGLGFRGFRVWGFWGVWGFGLHVGDFPVRRTVNRLIGITVPPIRLPIFRTVSFIPSFMGSGC